MKYTNIKKRTVNKKKNNSFLVTPPQDYPWVVLSKALGALTDYLDSSFTAEVTSIIRRRDYQSYLGLSDVYGLHCITRTEEIDLAECRARLLIVGLLKKYQFPADTATLRANAIDKFVEAEAHCSTVNRTLKESPFGVPDEDIVGVRSIVASILGELPPGISSDAGCRHGPGSTTSNSSMETSSYFKYGDLPYRVTSRAVDHARALISSDPRWLGAIEDKYRSEKGIPKWAILNWEVFWSSILEVNDENKVTTVPKDGRTDRPIAIENNLNIMLQLGVDNYIRKRLRRFGCDLNTQDHNKTLAGLGSMDEYPYSTIDLASASDTVSLRAAKLLLPDEWYRYLCDLRSPYGRLPDGRRIRYSKLSSMGNATTFVVESLLFFAVALYGTRKTMGARYRYREHIAVHGDDIIIPTDCYPIVTRTLSTLGFIVNSEKSFRYGPVKESCGSDWYEGNMVRPVFLRRPPANVMDIYSDRNRLFRWFSLYFPELDNNMSRMELDSQMCYWLGRNPLLTGPVSDEDFASYWHSPTPTQSKRNSTYRTLSVVNSAKQVHGCNEFLVRKLMHPLLDLQPCLTRKPDEVRVGGSRFAVVNRRSRVTMIYRSFPDWESSYRVHRLARLEN